MRAGSGASALKDSALKPFPAPLQTKVGSVLPGPSNFVAVALVHELLGQSDGLVCGRTFLSLANVGGVLGFIHAWFGAKDRGTGFPSASGFIDARSNAG